MNAELVLEAEDVCKSYGKLTAVRNVTLHVAAGEVYGLLGTNGAGKSTLLRMLTGIANPDSGAVRICGFPLDQNAARGKQLVGYLPEELIFYDRLSGREYLKFVAALKSAPVQNIKRELDFFELSAVADKWVGSYSLGMRKKLGLAVAFVSDPRVLMLDEPLNGLDVEMMRKLRERVDTSAKAGCAVIISSHVMSFVERVCQRVGIIRLGQLVAEGTPAQLRVQTGLPSAEFDDVFFALAS